MVADKKSNDGLIIIPARGGSKGIPRKNLRILGEYPLIYYVIKTALEVSNSLKLDVYVSTDDEEIACIASKFGAKIHMRNKELAGDEVTLDEVIYDAFLSIREKEGKDYDYIITVQPTSPFLKTSTLLKAVSQFKGTSVETLLSAKEVRHLMWKKINGKSVPLYTKRVNRQYMEPYYMETGAFVICKKSTLLNYKSRIGKRTAIFLLNGKEALDIDSLEDWALAEYFLTKKKILFVVTGNKEVGLGHVYRSLTLANSLLPYEIEFLVDKNSQLAYEKIAELNYKVHIQTEESLVEEIKRINPDIVINDILDTSAEYILSLKRDGFIVINFEDLGEGAQYADLVINALYPEKVPRPNHYFGYRYFIPRDEFMHSPVKKIEPSVENVLITFGGTDPSNLTLKTLESIYDFCKERGIGIKVILGLGYRDNYIFQKFKDISILENVKNMSEHMLEADIVFTSAGRTVYEIACIGTPTIVLAQNERELTHFFATAENGFVNLGLGVKVSKLEILNTFKYLVDNFEERKFLSELMLSRDIRSGRKRVLNLLKKTISSS